MSIFAPARRCRTAAAIAGLLALAGCSASIDGSPTNSATVTTPATAVGDVSTSSSGSAHDRRTPAEPLDPTTTPGPASTSSAPDVPSPSASSAPGPSDPGRELVQRPAEVDLPRTLHYAGAEITVTDAVVSNAAPSSWGTDHPFPTDTMRLYVSLETSFADGYPGVTNHLPVDRFLLLTEDGRVIAANAPGAVGGIPVPAEGTATDHLVFDIDPALVPSARFSFDDGAHIPAVVPLTGPIPESVYPIRTEPGASATTDFTTGCEPSPADVTLDAVEWDIDAGVGYDPDAKLIQGDTSRAANGMRWVRVQATVTAGAGQCGGTFVNHEQFTLRADGAQIPPSNGTSVTLQDGQSGTVSHVFAVPEDVAELTLLVGDADAEPHPFELTVPDELP